MNAALLLFTLLVCHYLADFCLTTPPMIRAKADGKNPWPILLHSSVHTILIGLCLFINGNGWKLLLPLMGLELASHFLIDTTKGRLTARFPILANNQQKPYWMLYGLDQLLHQLVVIIIWIHAK